MTSSSRLRTGAHRPRRRPGALAIPLMLALVVVAAIVGVRLLDAGGAGDGTGPAAATGARPSATPSSAPSASAPSGASSGPSSRGSSTSPSSPTVAVDRSAAVAVLNATRRAGLATRAAATLRSVGWSIASTGNYRQPPPPLTTVYYSGPQLRATARAVSADLPGVQRVERSSQFGDAVVTIVLGSDFPG